MPIPIIAIMCFVGVLGALAIALMIADAGRGTRWFPWDKD